MSEANLMVKSSRVLYRAVFTRFEAGVWIANIVNLLNWIGYSASFPLMMLYLHDARGLPATLAGTTLSLIAIPSIITVLIGGVLSDRFGRRRLLLVAAGTIVPLSIGVSILIWVSTPIWIIVPVIAVVMLIFGLLSSALRTIIADLGPKNRLSESYGLLSISTNLGWAIGTGVGGFLMAVLSFAWLWGAASLLGIASFLLILFLFRESFPGTKDHMSFRGSLSIVIANRNFLAFVGLSFMVLLVLLQLTNALSVFTIDHLGFSTAQYGLLLTANGLIIVFCQYAVSRSISWLGERKAVVLGSLLFCGYFSLSWFRSFVWVIGTMVIVTLGEMLFLPTMSSITAQLSPPEQRGRYMGLLGFSQALASSLAPMLGGVLLDTFPNTPLFSWGIFACMALAASMGFLLWNKAYRGYQSRKFNNSIVK